MTDTNIYILLDRSGSMVGRWGDTLGSINGYAKLLAEKSHPGTITVLSFSSGGAPTGSALLGVPTITEHRQNRTGAAEMLAHGIAVPVKEFRPLSASEVSPMGGTPLYDAVSHIVGVTQADRNAQGELHIFTDGEENSSLLCNADTAKLLLEGVRARGWVVNQYGVEFNNYRQAAVMGTDRRNTVSASTQSMRSGDFAKVMAANSMSYTSTGKDMGYGAAAKAAMGDTTEEAKAEKTP